MNVLEDLGGSLRQSEAGIVGTSTVVARQMPTWRRKVLSFVMQLITWRRKVSAHCATNGVVFRHTGKHQTCEYLLPLLRHGSEE